MNDKDLKGLGLKMVNGNIVKIKPDAPKTKIESFASGSFNLPKTKGTVFKPTIGKCYVNTGGRPTVIERKKFVPDKTRRFYVFDINPMGAVRMSSSDKWKTDPNHKDPNKRKRKSVVKHHSFADTLRYQASKLGYEVGKTLEAVFFIAMPESWSAKKKKEHVGLPHESLPDCDNIVKIFVDSLKEQDNEVWFIKAEKRWAYISSILVYQ
jgi:hypothetical protein